MMMKMGKGNKNIHKAAAAVAVFSALFLLGAAYLVGRVPAAREKARALVAVPSPTPMPFAQLTVPYLRSRSYSSKLGEMTPVQDYSQYTGYLTSYTSDGLKVNGLLTVPKGQTPKGGWPAIVFIHGYIPPAQYQTLERYVAYVDYLARNGFVVFKIDLRGHGQSQGTAGGGYYGSDYVVDTLNAYAALQKADFINPGKIGLWGHSMAGNTVMRALAARPQIPTAVIWAGAVYSYTDMQNYGLHDASYQHIQADPSRRARQNKVFAAYGRPNDGNPFWKLVAPINYVGDLKGAVEIHHAENDETVNIGYSRELVAALDKTKVPHEFYTYPTGGHNIADPSFSLAMERTVSFFRKHL